MNSLKIMNDLLSRFEENKNFRSPREWLTLVISSFSDCTRFSACPFIFTHARAPSYVKVFLRYVVSDIAGCALTFCNRDKRIYNFEAVNFSTRVYHDFLSHVSASSVLEITNSLYISLD